MFSTAIEDIEAQIDAINPVKYAKTRNFIDGDVTKLSPYISRGVISTKQVYNKMLAKGYKLWQMEKFVQELAWRDYYQQVWLAKGNAIDNDLKNEQPDVQHHQIPTAVVNGTTGIGAIDTAINEFYQTGYLHNHIRMYLASITCNVGKSHWYVPAQWMYYNLLDADWASNALSWQWTAGSFSSKKYYANQENINKYCYTNEWKTFLNVSYEALETLPIPKELLETTPFTKKTVLPNSTIKHLDSNKHTFLYNFYNLDPYWHRNEDGNRVLLLEPNFFIKYPSAPHVISFMEALATNITNLQIFVGSYGDLMNTYNLQKEKVFYKEHPTTQHYKGNEEPRDWLSPVVTGNFPSFFGYWKKLEKQLKQ